EGRATVLEMMKINDDKSASDSPQFAGYLAMSDRRESVPNGESKEASQHELFRQNSKDGCRETEEAIHKMRRFIRIYQ
ncbi:hypothetical protein PENTCL1PPCAC_12573, partial [Pristionchus entomophagus]